MKPLDQWPRGLTKQKLIAQMSERLNREIVGVDFNFSQYIQDNIEEAVSGVKGENSVKIFGRDLAELERLSRSVKTEIGQVPGVRDPAVFNLIGQPNLVIRIDRAKAARYGISVGDVNAVVQAAIGGQEITRVYEGEMNFALTVRLAPRYRDDVGAIRTVPVAVPGGDPKLPTTYIALTQTVPLPPGYRMEWTGEYGALVEAKNRLAFIVPLSLLLIMMLLYGLFNSIRDGVIALSGIPFAAAGGILGLYVAGLNASVSAAVGFISLFGVSAMDGILLVSYIRRALEDGLGTEQAIISAGKSRMRQVFMTGFSACIGLLPAAISTGIGSQVQQPLACVIVGGMLLSPICSLLVIPTLSRLLMPTIEGTDAGRASYTAEG